MELIFNILPFRNNDDIDQMRIELIKSLGKMLILFQIWKERTDNELMWLVCSIERHRRQLWSQLQHNQLRFELRLFVYHLSLFLIDVGHRLMHLDKPKFSFSIFQSMKFLLLWYRDFLLKSLLQLIIVHSNRDVQQPNHCLLKQISRCFLLLLHLLILPKYRFVFPSAS